MKKHRNFQKMTLAFGLLMTLILPTAGLANLKTNALPSSPKLLGNTDEIKKYSKFADLFITNCSNLDSQPRPSGEQLKRCLTISKELRDRMTAFLGSLDSLVHGSKEKIRGTRILTKNLSKSPRSTALMPKRFRKSNARAV